MKNRVLCHLIISVCILTACAGNKPATPVQVQVGTPTLAPATTATPTMIPSETPMPATTIPMTSTITPPPENFALAENGFDIADVRVVSVQADTVRIDFKYRTERNYALKPNQRLAVVLLIPSICEEKNNTDPFFNITDPVGSGEIIYNQKTKSRCSLPFFDLAIEVIGRYDATDVPFKEVYRERIQQPLEVTGNVAAIDARNLTVKNIEFHTSGPWSGQLTFDYAFRSDVSLAPGRYRFVMRAGAVVRACSLWTDGPAINSLEGKYILAINLSSAEDPTCLNTRDSFSYEGATISLKDDLTDAEPYSHAIGFTITLKKAP